MQHTAILLFEFGGSLQSTTAYGKKYGPQSTKLPAGGTTSTNASYW